LTGGSADVAALEHSLSVCSRAAFVAPLFYHKIRSADLSAESLARIIWQGIICDDVAADLIETK
jgi:hypothetical protein